MLLFGERGVVPVIKCEILRNCAEFIVVQRNVLRVSENVIAPDHAVQLMFCADFGEVREVGEIKLFRRNRVAEIKRGAEPESPRFIRSEVTAVRPVRFRCVENEMFEKFVRFRRVHLENARRIGERLESRVLEDVFQMPERLNAGEQFNAELETEVVEVADFLFGVCAASEADERHAGDGVSIFRVKSQVCQPECGEPLRGALQKRNGGNRPAGAVDHESAFGESRFVHGYSRL